MRLRALLGSFFLIFFFTSCRNKSGQVANAGTKDPAFLSALSADSQIHRFDGLENIFMNENWLIVNGKDTSFFYCSRLGKTYFKTYFYKILKGDSVNTMITEIKLAGDTVAWQILKDPGVVWLVNATPGKAVWTDKTNKHFVFSKIDNNNIRIDYPDGTSRNLFKMQTISSFLIRCKYDYLHGTKLAFAKK